MALKHRVTTTFITQSAFHLLLRVKTHRTLHPSIYRILSACRKCEKRGVILFFLFLYLSSSTMQSFLAITPILWEGMQNEPQGLSISHYNTTTCFHHYVKLKYLVFMGFIFIKYEHNLLTKINRFTLFQLVKSYTVCPMHSDSLGTSEAFGTAKTGSEGFCHNVCI